MVIYTLYEDYPCRLKWPERARTSPESRLHKWLNRSWASLKESWNEASDGDRDCLAAGESTQERRQQDRATSAWRGYHPAAEMAVAGARSGVAIGWKLEICTRCNNKLYYSYLCVHIKCVYSMLLLCWFRI
jgi:hypothetical protein